MPSRLSSLLVRDGLVGVKRMEKAFQRQVIYGGSLDTILLEMNLVPEERLTQYLALASGLPPAARDEGHTVEAAATALVPKELSQKYRAVPVALEGEAVRVLVCAPLEITELEDLADLLDRPLQPLIAPEYRWNLVFATAYSVDPPARFTTLARTLDVDPTTLPVGRAKTVIVDEASRPGTQPMPAVQQPLTPAGRMSAPLQSVASADETLKFPAADHEMDLDAEEPHDTARNEAPANDRVGYGTDEMTPIERADSRRSNRATMVGVTPNRASTDEGMFPAAKVPWIPTAEDDELPAVRTTVSPSSAGVPKIEDSLTRGTKPRQQSQPIPTEGRDAPLPAIRARELLAVAEDRDSVFLTMLRAARTKARWAGLMTVQGGSAIGRVALAEPTLDTTQIVTALVPLDVSSPFRQVVQTGKSYVGPLACGDPNVDGQLLRLGGTVPPSALLLPIVLRERVIAIVIAHRVLSDTRIVDVTELLPLGMAAADALGRLIAKSKAAGYRAPSEPPVAIPAVDDFKAEENTRPLGSKADEWRAPAQKAAQVPGLEPVEDLTITADPPVPIGELVDAIEAAPEGRADDAIAEAVERAGETLGELNRRFPGTLRVDRFSVNGRSLRAGQYGGLLELVISLGSAASELLIEKMGAAQRDVRFYATVCCAEIRPRTAVFQLAERLFDQDFGVRACAIEALAGYPMGELGHALVRARRALSSTDPEVVGAAATAVVALGDVEAVADLINALGRGDRPAEHARRALVALTAQDFGTSERKWRKWYDGAKGRHRVEWLIEGLVHKEDAIRESSINDLRRMTGEYFGYHYDLPRRDRDAAAARWSSWWKDAGQRRFSEKEDERNRPTGVLPARRP